MSDLTSAHRLADLIRAQHDPGSPIVRAGLERVMRAWTDGAYDFPDEQRMAALASAVQAVVTAQFRGLPTVVVVGDALPVDAAMELVLAAADVFSASAHLGCPQAWEYAAAAAQLRSAVGAETRWPE